jgi:hypothetical protein
MKIDILFEYPWKRAKHFALEVTYEYRVHLLEHYRLIFY